MSLREKQIREVLDYDVFQNRRVYDQQVKSVRAMNESQAQPKKSDLELDATLQTQVDALRNTIEKLTQQLPNLSLVAGQPDPNLFDYGVPPDDATIPTVSTQSSGVPASDVFDYSETGSIPSISTLDSDLGRNNLELKKYIDKMKSSFDESLANVVSQYNGIVNTINNKDRENVYSKQNINYLISKLAPVVQSAKQFLAYAITLRNEDTQLYTRSTGIIKKLVDLIEEAPPLIKLDASMLSNKFFVGKPEGAFEYNEVRRQIAERKRKINDIKQLIKQAKDEFRDTTQEEKILNELEKIGPYGIELSQKNKKSSVLPPLPPLVQGQGRMKGGVWENGADPKRDLMRTRFLTNSFQAIGQDPEEANYISRELARRQHNKWFQEKLYPMGPYPYLGLKDDNSRGRLDENQERNANNLVNEVQAVKEEVVEETPKQEEALEGTKEGGCDMCETPKKAKGKGKKVSMTKKNFAKEHKKLIGLLSNTSSDLKKESNEQLSEMKKIAPEDALQVEKAILHKQKKMKGGAKKKRQPTKKSALEYDEKKNDDWFM